MQMQTRVLWFCVVTTWPHAGLVTVVGGDSVITFVPECTPFRLCCTGLHLLYIPNHSLNTSSTTTVVLATAFVVDPEYNDALPCY